MNYKLRSKILLRSLKEIMTMKSTKSIMLRRNTSKKAQTITILCSQKNRKAESKALAFQAY